MIILPIAQFGKMECCTKVFIMPFKDLTYKIFVESLTEKNAYAIMQIMMSKGVHPLKTFGSCRMTPLFFC